MILPIKYDTLPALHKCVRRTLTFERMICIDCQFIHSTQATTLLRVLSITEIQTTTSVNPSLKNNSLLILRC